MPTKYDDVNALLDEFNTVTNDLSTGVDKLIADINRTATEGMTGPQTENVLGRLSALSTTLKGIAANANAPIPTLPPAPPAMPGPFQP